MPKVPRLSLPGPMKGSQAHNPLELGQQLPVGIFTIFRVHPVASYMNDKAGAKWKKSEEIICLNPIDMLAKGKRGKNIASQSFEKPNRIISKELPSYHKVNRSMPMNLICELERATATFGNLSLPLFRWSQSPNHMLEFRMLGYFRRSERRPLT